MRPTQYLRKLFAATAFTAATVLLSGGSILAQPGKGKGHGKHGGPPGHQKHEERREARQQQQWGDWNGRRQQQWNDHNARRQQELANWNTRRQQQINDWNAKRQHKQNERYAKRRQQIFDWNARSQRQQDNWQDRRRRVRDDDRWERRRARQVYYSPVQIFNTWNGRQWGQWNASVNRHRRDLKHAWKEERKAQRRFEKEQRKYARLRDREDNYNSYGNYYGGDNYHPNDYGYDDGSSWKQHLLRTVIANFLVGNGDDRFDVPNRLDDGRFVRSGYREPVPAYYNSPLYVNYSPDYGYGPEYVDDSFANGNGFDFGGLLGQLPIGDLLGNNDGGFVSELLGNLLNQGYDQGFLAGNAARENGHGDRYFNDPYLFQGGVCDPYSTTIGDNREILSQGYALGYQDALNGRDDYEPFTDGNTDLVSLLLNNVLSRV